MIPYSTLLLHIKSLRLPLKILNQSLESQEYTDIVLSSKMLSQKLTEILNELDGHHKIELDKSKSISLQWIKESSK